MRNQSGAELRPKQDLEQPGALPPVRVRRNQQERREATRQALLDATVESLVEKGFAGTSTSVVCKRAGLSQGALFGHFASKNDLLVATAAQVNRSQLARLPEEVKAARSQGRTSEIRDGVGKPAKTQKSQKAEKAGKARLESDHIDLAISALWELLGRPEMTALYELRLGARTDPTLRRRLAKQERLWERSVKDACGELFPDLGGQPGWSTASTQMLELLQALALARLLEQIGEEHRLLQMTADLARSSLRKGKRRGLI